jgi:hypothetical protein
MTKPAYAQDIIPVVVHETNEPGVVMVSIPTPNGDAFAASLPKDMVDSWIEEGQLGGNIMNIVMTSHPAAAIVNDLMPLLSGLSHIAKPEQLDAFRQRTIETLMRLGYLRH